jgi:hypothetical protein
MGHDSTAGQNLHIIENHFEIGVWIFIVEPQTSILHDGPNTHTMSNPS